MAVLISLLLLALSVREDHTVLRAACASDAEAVATLAAGTPLSIRYALPGESTACYKVAIPSGGEAIEGYLSASAIEGLEDFERGRRDAAWLDVTQAISAIRTSERYPAMATGGSQSLAGEAARLIETSQPSKALNLLAPEIRRRKNPALLALAGVAAWRADDNRRALEYWRSALEIQPNPEIERLYRRVERETSGDQSADRILGLRVLLRYDSLTVSAETARRMVTVLDDEFLRISGQLGCNVEERIVAIVQSRDAYRKTIDAAEWNGGQYDGRIRVPVFDGQGVDAPLRRALAHETTHACLSMLGRWPAWLQEGLAQKFSGDTLTPAMRQKLATIARDGKLPRLDNLSQDWSRLDTEHAALAYAMSLAAVELFYENYREYRIGNLIRNSERLAQITADLDQRLRL